MKRVVREQEESVSISEASANKFYGVDFLDGDTKGFITYRLNIGFVVQSCFYLTQCQLRFNANSPNEKLNSFISRLIEEEYNVYEFETYQELFKWLSE